MSVTFPDASRNAEPPANTTKTAYEIMEITRDSSVPFGIDLAGSFKSPDMLAPACIPVTNGLIQTKILYEKNFSIKQCPFKRTND